MIDPITLPALPEPDSYLFQHEDTGLTQFVDAQQVEWGFEKNNPRWKRISGAFTEAQMEAYARAAVEADRQARKPLSEEQIESLARPFVRTLGGDHYSQGQDGIPDRGQIEEFARAIEREHGIGGNDAST